MARAQKKDLPAHYLVTVEGTYYDKIDGDKTMKQYKFTFPVPVQVKATVPEKRFDTVKQQFIWEDVTKMMHIDDYGIMRFLKNSKKLSDKCELQSTNFVGIRTHNIVHIEASSPEIPLPSNPYVLNLVQLRKFVKANSWPVDLTLFTSLEQLREAVLNYKEDPVSYKVYEDRFKQRNAVRSAFSSEMESLEEFYDAQEAETNTVKAALANPDKEVI